MKTMSKSMLLLLAAIVMGMGITIYAACSLDDDDFGASQSELESNADGVLDLSNEHQGTVFFVGVPIKRGEYEDDHVEFKDTMHVGITTHWINGYTGNITPPHSDIYCSISLWNDGRGYEYDSLGGGVWYYNYISFVDAKGEWIEPEKLKMTLSYIHSIYNYINHSLHYINYNTQNSTLKKMSKIYTFDELGCELDSTLLN